MLAHREAMKILGHNAVDLLDERFEGYRAEAVRKLKAIIDVQVRSESDAKRQSEVVAELDALANLLVKKSAP
jgi:3-mercaptopyruvate sulfurtransferase SseA